MEDIITVASWANLDIHRKPTGLLNVNHFFDFLLVFLDDAKRLGFLSKSTSDIFLSAEKTDDLIDQLLAYHQKSTQFFPSWNGQIMIMARSINWT